MEWVLMIWVMDCGYGGCDAAEVQQFAIYETQAECKEVLLDWTITESTRHMEPKYRQRNYDLGGKCMKRPK